MKRYAVSLALVSLCSVCFGAGSQSDARYRDPNADAEQRIASLLAAMTLDEKIHALGTDSAKHGMSKSSGAPPPSKGSTRMSACTSASESGIDVEVDVRNTGARDGEEVVQVYVQHVDSKVPRPERALKAFQRVELPAGRSKVVKLRVAARDLAYWDEATHRFVVEADTIRVLVGSSSADTRLSGTVRVKSPLTTKNLQAQ